MRQLFIRVDNFFHFDRVKKWAYTLLLIGACVIIYEVIRIGDHIADMTKAIKAQAESQTYSKDLAAYTEQKKADIDVMVGDAKQATANVKDLTGNLNTDLHANLTSLRRTTDEATGLVADLRINTRPRVDTGIDILNSSLSQMSSDLHGQQIRISQIFDDNAPNVLKATTSIAAAADNFDKTSAKLFAYVSDEKVQQFIDEALSKGKEVFLKLDKIAGNVDVMSADGKKIVADGVEIADDAKQVAEDGKTFIHGQLTAKPPWWKRYILQPLREGAGTTYLILKITNGLN